MTCSLDVWFSVLDCVSGCDSSEALPLASSVKCLIRYRSPVATVHHQGDALLESWTHPELVCLMAMFHFRWMVFSCVKTAEYFDRAK